MDEFLEKLQTAFDPFFGKIYCKFSQTFMTKVPVGSAPNLKWFFLDQEWPPSPLPFRNSSFFGGTGVPKLWDQDISRWHNISREIFNSESLGIQTKQWDKQWGQGTWGQWVEHRREGQACFHLFLAAMKYVLRTFFQKQLMYQCTGYGN